MWIKMTQDYRNRHRDEFFDSPEDEARKLISLGVASHFDPPKNALKALENANKMQKLDHDKMIRSYRNKTL